MATLPSREYLLECFDYNKETDTLTWKKRPAEHFDSAGDYKRFTKILMGKTNKSKSVCINKSRFSRTKIVFKILYGTEPHRQVNQKGYFSKYNGYYRASFRRNNDVFSKSFKTEIEAQEWLKEMRVKFEKNQIPIVKHKKISNHGFHGVVKLKNSFYAQIGFNKDYFRIKCNTAKEASDAYQLAKQQIKDGTFIPPKKILSNTGFKGVRSVYGDKFMARYKQKTIGTFDTPEEAHAAYLKAKNHKTFDDGLDILNKLAKQYG